MSNVKYNPPRKTCTQCGKSFICHAPEEWAYRKSAGIRGTSRMMHFCSWGCMRKYEKEHELSSRRDTALMFE